MDALEAKMLNAYNQQREISENFKKFERRMQLNDVSQRQCPQFFKKWSDHRTKAINDLENITNKLMNIARVSRSARILNKSIGAASGTATAIGVVLLPFTLGISSTIVVVGAIGGLTATVSSISAKTVEYNKVRSFLDKVQRIITTDYLLYQRTFEDFFKLQDDDGKNVKNEINMYLNSLLYPGSHTSYFGSEEFKLYLNRLPSLKKSPIKYGDMDIYNGALSEADLLPLRKRAYSTLDISHPGKISHNEGERKSVQCTLYDTSISQEKASLSGYRASTSYGREQKHSHMVQFTSTLLCEHESSIFYQNNYQNDFTQYCEPQKYSGREYNADSTHLKQTSVKIESMKGPKRERTFFHKKGRMFFDVKRDVPLLSEKNDPTDSIHENTVSYPSYVPEIRKLIIKYTHLSQNYKRIWNLRNKQGVPSGGTKLNSELKQKSIFAIANTVEEMSKAYAFELDIVSQIHKNTS